MKNMKLALHKCCCRNNCSETDNNIILLSFSKLHGTPEIRKGCYEFRSLSCKE